MKVLHLTLKKKWFDMIASGEKKEEYREIKPYWENRLIDQKHQTRLDASTASDIAWKEFDVVKFTNGYAKDAPIITVECLGITIDYGMSIWGAVEGQQYFIIRLGEIL